MPPKALARVLAATAVVVGCGLITSPVPRAAGATTRPAHGPSASSAPTDYQHRAARIIFDRATAPLPTGCNHTAYLTYATATLWMDQNVADANAKLAGIRLNQIGNPPAACDPSIDEARNNLMLGYLIRPYMLYSAASSYFPGRMTPGAESNLVAQMWAYAQPYSRISEARDAWSIYDSENHDAQVKSFDYLAASIFAHRADYRNRRYADGSTVAEQYKAWRDHWSNYFDERAKRGLFIEVGSPLYHGYTLEAILNIYDFAQDPVLRAKARMILDLDLADYVLQELHNVRGGPKSRSYPADSYDGAVDTTTNLGDLLFGSPAPLNGDNHTLALATSGYTPPPVIDAMAADRAALGSFAYVSRRPGVGLKSFDQNKDWHVTPARSVLDYTFVTPDYIMGTAELTPNEVDIAPSAQNRWQGIIFDTGSGDRVYPQAAPSDVRVANNAFLSVQHANVLITAKTASMGYPTLVYFPSTLDAVAERSGWIFVKEGAAYLAVRPATGSYHWLSPSRNRAPDRNERFIALTNQESPIIFEAARASGYSSFSAFEARIIARHRSYVGGVLNYVAGDGTKLTFYHGGSTAPKINGHPLDYAPSYVFDSPFMRSVWGSGKITVQLGARRATYDFSNPAHPTRVVR